MSGSDLTKQNSQIKKTLIYSSLNNKHIKEKHYEHAQKVWEEFEFKSLGEYHRFISKNGCLFVSRCF